MSVELAPFFAGLRLAAAEAYLRFLYYMASEDRARLGEDAFASHQLVRAAELMTLPEAGRGAYMDYARKLAATHNIDISPVQRYMLRHSAMLDVWSVPVVLCAGCNQHGKLQCSRCTRQFYCSARCQVRSVSQIQRDPVE